MSIPPIYVINLKRTPERRLYMQRQLDALNLDYQIVDAIDKYDLISKEYRMKIAYQLGISESWMEEAYEKITNNGWAVSLSHIKVFNMMKKDNVPVACILEDDAHLSPDFPIILRDSQKISWDVLQLSSCTYTFYNNLKRIIDTCPGSSPFPKRPLINLLRVFKKLGSYAPRLPLYTAWRLVTTVIEIIYETIIGYFYFLIVGRSNKHYGWRIREFIYRNGAGYYIATYCASRIGGLPIRDRKLWYKLTFKYYMIPSQNLAGTASGYMITLKMTNTFKQALNTGYLHIDRLFYELTKRGMKSYVLSPPCVGQTLRYLCYSAKDR